MTGAPVTVLTPVYNGAEFLGECIESVLAQSYADFEYVIVDNCSTDGTVEIARHHAARDSRVRVETNEAFVGLVQNHNRALRHLGRGARYCKFVSADDWITPDCLERMVSVAEKYPRAGIVGCYQASVDSVRWRGLPATVEFCPGRQVARMGLLHGVYVLGTPTSALYRAEMVRSQAPFFPHNEAHADTSACYQALQHWDFAFVHAVLCGERVHAGQWTTHMNALDSGWAAFVDVLFKYGPSFLTPQEMDARKKDVFDEYYRCLGERLWQGMGRNYWRFHRTSLSSVGVEFEWSRVVRAALAQTAPLAGDPRTAARKAASLLTLWITKLARVPGLRRQL